MSDTDALLFCLGFAATVVLLLLVLNGLLAVQVLAREEFCAQTPLALECAGVDACLLW